MTQTITEALAEIKTLGKRVAKKREFVQTYLARQDALKDPLLADGGSPEAIRRELQAITVLEQRVVELRAEIAAANASTPISIGGVSRSIADWLTWRREVAPARQQFLAQLRARIEGVRQQALSKGFAVVTASASVGDAAKPTDVLVNVSEAELAAEIEALEATLGDLDGQLSLKNATTSF